MEVLGGPLDGEALPARAGAIRRWGQEWRLTRKPDGQGVIRGEGWPVAGETDIGAYRLVWLSGTVPKWLWNDGEHLDWYLKRLASQAAW